MRPKKKACKVCSAPFEPRSSLQIVCGYKCAAKYASEKETNKRVKEMKTAVKTLPNIKKLLESKINKIVRLIDYGHPCISSGIPFGQYMVAAGHYYSVGANGSLRYNLLNIYGQSFSDNSNGGGKGSNYGANLIKLFGLEVFEEINALPDKYKAMHFSLDDLKKANNECTLIIKELSCTELSWKTDERITARKWLNKRIGLYI